MKEVRLHERRSVFTSAKESLDPANFGFGVQRLPRSRAYLGGLSTRTPRNLSPYSALLPRHNILASPERSCRSSEASCSLWSPKAYRSKEASLCAGLLSTSLKHPSRRVVPTSAITAGPSDFVCAPALLAPTGFRLSAGPDDHTLDLAMATIKGLSTLCYSFPSPGCLEDQHVDA